MTKTASPMASGAKALPPQVHAHSNRDRDQRRDAGGGQALRRAEQIAALPRQQRPERHGDHQRHEQRRKGQIENGAPTEILSPVSTSSASGYSVPINTVAQAAVRNRLLSTSAPSREIGANSPPCFSAGARKA